MYLWNKYNPACFRETKTKENFVYGSNILSLDGINFKRKKVFKLKKKIVGILNWMK